MESVVEGKGLDPENFLLAHFHCQGYHRTNCGVRVRVSVPPGTGGKALRNKPPPKGKLKVAARNCQTQFQVKFSTRMLGSLSCRQLTHALLAMSDWFAGCIRGLPKTSTLRRASAQYCDPFGPREKQNAGRAAISNRPPCCTLQTLQCMSDSGRTDASDCRVAHASSLAPA